GLILFDDGIRLYSKRYVFRPMPGDAGCHFALSPLVSKEKARELISFLERTSELSEELTVQGVDARRFDLSGRSDEPYFLFSTPNGNRNYQTLNLVCPAYDSIYARESADYYAAESESWGMTEATGYLARPAFHAFLL